MSLAILREALLTGHPDSTLRPELLATVLAHDEWLSYVRHWRENDGTKDQRTLTYVRRFGDGHLPAHRADTAEADGFPGGQGPADAGVSLQRVTIGQHAGK